MANKSREQQLSESRCYGVAYEKTARECKICEVKAQCSSRMPKSDGGDSESKENKPATPPTKTAASTSTSKPVENKTTTNSTSAKGNKKSDKPADNFPYDTKSMSMDELLKWAKDEIGMPASDIAELETKFANKQQILRMQVTMKAKKLWTSNQG